MKLSIKHLLLLSAVALAAQSSAVLAEEVAAAVDAADDAAGDAADAGNECAADGSCASEDEAAPATEEEAPEEEAAPAAEEATPEAEEEAEEESAAEDESPAEAEAAEEEAEEEEEEDPKCPSRPHVIRCAAKYLDTDQNGALERAELDAAMTNVPWLLRGLLKVIGSTGSIMKKCDADGDGKITIEEDMAATEETCLATCFKRKSFKSLFFPECTE